MVRPQSFQTIDACIFDAYGTLLDFGSAVSKEAAILGDKAGPLVDVWRVAQLEYTWLRSLMQRYADFWQVTNDALDHAMETLEINDSELRGRLLEAYRVLSPYPEVTATLRALEAAGMPRAILSNGSPDMLDAAFGAAKLTQHLDAILSAHSVGVFKPSPEVYALATQELGIAADRVAFFSSNSWDIHGASSFGFRTFWVNRRGLKPDRLPGGPEQTLLSLKEVQDWFAPR
ncbi:MAG: haloacid dehalogenase type II [Pseudomonadota bacterium]